ncbi:cytochrome P450 [Aspergillus ellipticus CBS 707.79]|uniref:Cytochrome P450 n=1 Tax=Aspergillus ellipticus CBS 707.79 TaxID=1448320 RepID=A0A319DU61_9EURO|nr:cytochrome P450 [Aspergillus ellipticus CBS 707.79]
MAGTLVSQGCNGMIRVSSGLLRGGIEHLTTDRKGYLQLHEKYGPVARMAPDELSYSDSAAWRDIYASHPSRPGGMVRDTAFYESLDEKDAIPSMFNANDKDHSRIRRTYAKAFSKQALAAQEPLITAHITRLMKIMPKQQDQLIDLVHIQFGLLRNSTILAALADLPILKAIFQLTLPHLVRRARATHFGWMKTKLDDRMASKTNRPDIVHFVMEKAGPEATISEAELRVNLPLVMIAQTESTVTVLSGMMAFLLDSPKLLQQLKDEVRSTFQTSSDINVATIEKMKVLNASSKTMTRSCPGFGCPIEPKPIQHASIFQIYH